ncbi:hypothetical protein COB28_02495 [Candidatus Dependentiae bacterium]|nr:MAG: hypothetical protein COB28_02495 [Candidatus Dependentiae bacterium]
MIFKVLFFVHALMMTLVADPYREPLVKSFLNSDQEEKSSLWVSSINSLEKKLTTQGAAPGVVCITHSSLDKTEELSTLLQETQEALGEKAQVFCIDAKDESLQQFIVKVKQQLGLRHMPLPAFLFFKQSSIVLPIQAGVGSSNELVHIIRQRFSMPDNTSTHSKRKFRSKQKKS